MSSEATVTTKRTVRRTVVASSDADVDSDVRVHRYQVYRGMSPETSNRLEIRIKELENALE